jgi:hypothetical protein
MELFMTTEKTFDDVVSIDYGGTYVVNAEGVMVRQNAHSTSPKQENNAVAEAAPGPVALGMASAADGDASARAKALAKGSAKTAD